MRKMPLAESTVDQVRTIIADQLDVNIPREEIEPDSGLLEDGLGLDSIAIVELITLIEENFGFTFDEDGLNMEIFQSVRTLAEYIQRQQQPELTK